MPVPERVPPYAVSTRALIWHALTARRRDLVLAMVLASTHQLGESLVPVIVGAALGHAVAGGSWLSMLGWLAVLAADFAFLSMSFRFAARAAVRVEQYAEHQARMWLTERVIGPVAQRGLGPPGDLLSRASSDAARIGQFGEQLPFFVAAGAVLTTSTMILLWISPPLGAVILLGTAVQLLGQHRTAAALERRSEAEQAAQGDAAALAEDLVRGLRVLRGIGVHHHAVESYRRASRDAATAALRAAATDGTLAALGALFGGLYLTVVVGLGGWLALTGHLGLGELVAALGVARFVLGPMEAIAALSAAWARGRASASRLREVLLAIPEPAEPAFVEGGSPPLPGPGALDLVDIPGAGESTLTLTVPAGQMTGLVCVEPSDAVAVPLLLAREEEPAAGSVRLDETELAAWSLDALRATVVVSFHDATLLPGSVAENLGLLAPPTSAVLQAATVDQVLEVVPEGGATLVGDRGERLSGGQRQRVALGRALAADAPVLVLHDPTTAVDAVTEDAIAEGVRRLRAARTTLVVTTSPAWLSRCDQVVLWGHDGCVRGTHAQLLADRADYRSAVAR